MEKEKVLVIIPAYNEEGVRREGSGGGKTVSSRS